MNVPVCSLLTSVHWTEIGFAPRSFIPHTTFLGGLSCKPDTLTISCTVELWNSSTIGSLFTLHMFLERGVRSCQHVRNGGFERMQTHSRTHTHTLGIVVTCSLNFWELVCVAVHGAEAFPHSGLSSFLSTALSVHGAEVFPHSGLPSFLSIVLSLWCWSVASLTLFFWLISLALPVCGFPFPQCVSLSLIEVRRKMLVYQ